MLTRDLKSASHRRYNPLTQEWVLVSPHRLDRPWQGERAETAQSARPAYDPTCYLCPGNVRANGEHNPHYTATYAFDNDFAALQPHAAGESIHTPIFRAEPESGRCRVVCFSPRHDLDIGTMRERDVRTVVDTWADESRALLSEGLRAVTVFENRGAMMGASNPHPHSQIWANEHVPNELVKERAGFDAYGASCLLCDYAAEEMRARERVVYEDPLVCVVVPFWAVWPFEALMLPRACVAWLDACDDALRDALARAMQALVQHYDALFGVSFPYSMGWHQDRHLHAHYYPPLLRSAVVRKFQVGYEMLAQPQRDLTPEEAALRLREA